MTPRSVRVLCLDADDRVLLLHWRCADDVVWEPPGGGVEPGESDHDAARREWHEETGLDPAWVSDRSVVVHRDEWWAGRHYVVDEPVFLARTPLHAPPTRRDGLVGDEPDLLCCARWTDAADRAALEDPVTPDVDAVLALLGSPTEA